MTLAREGQKRIKVCVWGAPTAWRSAATPRCSATACLCLFELVCACAGLLSLSCKNTRRKLLPNLLSQPPPGPDPCRAAPPPPPPPPAPASALLRQACLLSNATFLHERRPNRAAPRPRPPPAAAAPPPAAGTKRASGLAGVAPTAAAPAQRGSGRAAAGQCVM